MKGLIRNNFYTVEGSLKTTLLISFISIIVLAISGKVYGDNSNILSLIIAANIAGYGSLVMTVMQKDAASKWNKFELTMPVTRNDVITARYISSMLYVFIGIAVSVIGIFVFYLVTGTVNLERVGYGFTFGIGFTLTIPTFMIPLVMIFGTDKTEPIMFVSVVMGLVLFSGSSVVATPLLKNIPNSDFLFRLIYMVLIILLFVISYLLSSWIYKKKEL